MRRDVDVSRLEEPRADALFGSTHVHDPVLERMVADGVENLGFQVAFADQKEARLRRLRTNPRQRSGQHLDAVPPSKCPNKGDHPSLVGQSE